jgi:hypothetical protein
LLEVRQVSKIVNSQSEEAKNFRFPEFDGVHARGNIEFFWDVFYCAKCEKGLTIPEVLKYERVVIKGKSEFPLGLSEKTWSYIPKIVFILLAILFFYITKR